MVTTNNISIAAPPGLVSIIIPCCGMLDYTKLCVPSVLRHSREPYELIFLDIGSLDGTAEYLAGVRDAAPVRVEVVRTPADKDLFVYHFGSRTFAHGAPEEDYPRINTKEH